MCYSAQGAALATVCVCAGPSSVYIKNLPPDADKLFLYQRFAPHGAIQSVKVLTDEDSQQCKGVGFVNYVVPTGAMLAVQVSTPPAKSAHTRPACAPHLFKCFQGSTAPLFWQPRLDPLMTTC